MADNKQFQSDKQLSESFTEYFDAEYAKFWNIDTIKRHKYEEAHADDVLRHIDTEVRLANGSVKTVQEKIMRNKFADKQTVTFEFYQNFTNKIGGEWFNNFSQYYFHGYSNSDDTGFLRYIVLYFPVLHDWWIYNKDKFSKPLPIKGSNAGLIWINYTDIPSQCIFRSYNI